MTQSFTNRRYLDALADHVVVFDGANGTQLQLIPLTPEDFGGERLNGCFDALALTRPDILERVHSAYYAAGSEAVETNTFRANRITLREYGLRDRVLEINRGAAQAARRAAERYAAETGIPRFVAGSIGPSGMLPSADDPVLSAVTFDELAAVFCEQAVGLIEGGVDLLLVETSQDILEVKAAIAGIQQAFAQTGRKIPLQCQVTLDVTGRMLLGTDIAAALATLEPLPIDVIGLNCSTGPEHMTEPIRYLGEHSRKPVSCLPNAGLPLNVDGQAVYPLQPEPFAEALDAFVREHGVNVVGGCCGTTPEHIRRLLARLGARPEQRRFPARTPEHEPQVASAMRATALIQDPPPMLIGERINTQGSRAVKKLLLADDYDGLLQIAREQVEGGAHALDVCVALTERADEPEQMRRTVKLLASGVEAPLVIDSTELPALEVALKTYPGRLIVNPGSLLDGGPERVRAVLELVSAHRAAVMLMTIDEQGMAKTAARKFEVAQRIYELCTREFGLAPEDLIFDALTFTLATGQEEFVNAAVETLEAIRLIKTGLPGALCSLGVSNLSFGLKPAARGVLNSVFLYHCVEAGLDMAIVNPKHVTPYAEIPETERALADDLIFNRRPDALPRYIEHFESAVAAGAEAAAGEAAAQMSAEERIHYQILHRRKEGVEALIDEALTRHDPVWVLNNVLLPAMKDVGDRFGAGELILPFVLQSAEVMKKSVRHLEQFLEKKEGVTKGKVVLATVYGDVHDIGKSLVNTILSNNGYTTFDLGKQVPVNVIVDKAVEYGATAVGLSALLVSTSKQMPLVVQELHRRGLDLPVLIGGAAINRKFGRRTLFVEPPADGSDGVPYAPGVFYCKDAFEGLEVMDQLCDAPQRAALLARTRAEAYAELGRARAHDSGPAPAVDQAARYHATRIPVPPFWGARTVREVPLQSAFAALDRDELFRLSWGAKNAHGAEWERLRADFTQRLERMQREAVRDGYLAPRAVYGYFPCNAEGDSVVVYDPEPFAGPHPGPAPLAALAGEGGRRLSPALREVARFAFPRQPDGERRCIADYFAPRASGQVDVLALQVVTVGPGADERFAALQARGDYAEAYFLHGLAVQTAEGTAEYLHRHIRRELGIEGGKRYSWGYPSCPDLEDHAQVFRLLPAERELGMHLTSAFQLIPEQSTAAIVVYHPEAAYFSVGVSRVEQLINA
jgi:5-methyltetrahydrofolate--homocysteine methyltransferase